MQDTLISVIQIILSAILIGAVLIQQKGGASSGLFGGSTNVYSTKRGVDKILHYTTIVIAVLFFGMAFTLLVIS
jgi:protein translocase SecG subunit